MSSQTYHKPTPSRGSSRSIHDILQPLVYPRPSLGLWTSTTLARSPLRYILRPTPEELAQEQQAADEPKPYKEGTVVVRYKRLGLCAVLPVVGQGSALSMVKTSRGVYEEVFRDGFVDLGVLKYMWNLQNVVVSGSTGRDGQFMYRVSEGPSVGEIIERARGETLPREIYVFEQPSLAVRLLRHFRIYVYKLLVGRVWRRDAKRLGVWTTRVLVRVVTALLWL